LTPIADLAPLCGLPLENLNFAHTPVADLAPLRGTALIHLVCHSTRVTDLSPVKDLPLKQIQCDFKVERDAALLRSIKTLETINDRPVAEVLEGAAGK
jgi:hypothetical protein